MGTYLQGSIPPAVLSLLVTYEQEFAEAKFFCPEAGELDGWGALVVILIRELHSLREQVAEMSFRPHADIGGEG